VPKSTSKLRFWLKIAIFFIPCAYAVNFWYALNQNQTGGTFGDTFGAANALFSGVALMMLVYAVVLQRDELEITKEDRDTTRNLLSGQERINALQESALNRQIFEQSFNSLLRLVSDELARLSSPPPVGSITTVSQLSFSGYRARDLIEITNSGIPLSSDHSYARSETYKVFFSVNLLIHLATMIDQSAPDPVMKKPLSQLITSLLNPDVALCVAWFVVENRLQGGMMKNFE
jgi:hypothetical protein